MMVSWQLLSLSKRRQSAITRFMLAPLRDYRRSNTRGGTASSDDS
jgi:hypothetical protein